VFSSRTQSSFLRNAQLRLFSSSSPLAALQPGQQAPDFGGSAVINGQLKQVKLAEYRGKYVVLFFYPADFTFVCPTEIIAFNDRAADFRKINCELIAVSTDTAFSHLAWTQTPRNQGGLGDMQIPLLADRSQSIARSYGVLHEQSGNAFRGLFVIDAKGALRSLLVNDMPLGRSVDEALRLVQACQHFDKNGEVCPANWKPGQDAMKVSEASAYFKKHY
jgi:peroxiredoxin 1